MLFLRKVFLIFALSCVHLNLSYAVEDYPFTGRCAAYLEYVDDLVRLPEDTYRSMRNEVISAFEANVMVKLPYDNGFSFSVKGSGFELLYDKAELERKKSGPFAKKPKIMEEHGVLKISTTSKWLSFLAYAISTEDLVPLLKSIKAYKVQLSFHVPEVSPIPKLVDLTPLESDTPYPTRFEQKKEALVKKVKSLSPLGRENRFREERFQQIIQLRTINSEQIFGSWENPHWIHQRLLMSFGYADETALLFLNRSLGLPLEKIVVSGFVGAHASDILSGLGYEYSPAFRFNGYWQSIPSSSLFKTLEKENSAYRKIVAALHKFNELDLVYVDSRKVHSSGESMPYGIMTKTQYQKSWGKMGKTPSHFNGDVSNYVSGIPVYSGFGDIVNYLENSGYYYLEEQGYVTIEALKQH